MRAAYPSVGTFVSLYRSGLMPFTCEHYSRNQGCECKGLVTTSCIVTALPLKVLCGLTSILDSLRPLAPPAFVNLSHKRGCGS
jgi:hypothetical protein